MSSDRRHPAQNGALLRAEASINAMDRGFGIAGEPGHYRDEIGKSGEATAWSFGQALDAKLDVGPATHERGVGAMLNTLGGYRLGDAFAPSIHPGRGEHRFEDDNGWIGLDFMKAYQQTHDKSDLKRAEGLFPFMQAGQVAGGGEHWEEHAASPVRNMAASGSTAEVALELYQATKQNKYLRFAEKNEQFMDSKLRRPDGMYDDTLKDSGGKDTSTYTYNQGVGLGTDLGLYKATHDKKYLNLAEQTASSSIDYFSKNDRLFHAAPSFNSIYFQNLEHLDETAHDPRYKQTLDAYLGQAWSQGRDAKTGLFDRGGIGHYDHGHMGLLDQSAFAQMYAMDASWGKKK